MSERSAVGTPPVRVRAPGKVNVFMRVGLRRPDGYHNVATAFQAVSLFEEVRASLADDITIRFSGSIDTRRLATDETNLAFRAARLLADYTGYDGGVHLDIEKNVPIAGGMGGGSADAAATLVACDALWQTNVGRDDLLVLAAQLGADVPFAVVGGTAIGTGRGDELSPALATGQFHWVLALADISLSTPDVYQECDRHRERHSAEILSIPENPSVDAGVLQALRAGDPFLLAESLTNDLQAPAIHLAPSIASVLEQGEAGGALAGLVSGSGPTVAFLTESRDSALSLQIQLSASGIHALKVTAPATGARILAE